MYVCLGGPTKQHDFVTRPGPKCNEKSLTCTEKKTPPATRLLDKTRNDRQITPNICLGNDKLFI